MPREAKVQGGIPFFYDSVADGRPVRVVILREFISDPQFDGWTTVTVWQTVRQRQVMSRRFAQESAVLLMSVVAAAGLLLWFGIQFGPSSFGIFDAFPDEDGRQAHLSGEVAKALGEKTGELFEEPVIEQLDVVAEKQPA